jgi:hypothetical protein
MPRQTTPRVKPFKGIFRTSRKSEARAHARASSGSGSRSWRRYCSPTSVVGQGFIVWWGSAGRTTETFRGAVAAARFSNLHKSLRWLWGSIFSSLRNACISDVFAFRRLLFPVPPALGTAGRILDSTWLGGYMEAPRIFSFISGLKRPVLSSIDIANFAPKPARGQYPRGEQQVHFP